ncbi:hypothetical protein L873DRAFT_837633 [Choiromyces venosus 120613-1]|uniref:Uncharacterized protein n=1 Tax=Choiromyces venosus 120613-1 TaxID=1336337 RepID=A0A3N4JT73_9PEZI|nr:hypothetical protein L873DRAFT_837633 [Choiromyces venosus 120613-1]
MVWYGIHNPGPMTFSLGSATVRLDILCSHHMLIVYRTFLSPSLPPSSVCIAQLSGITDKCKKQKNARKALGRRNKELSNHMHITARLVVR